MKITVWHALLFTNHLQIVLSDHYNAPDFFLLTVATVCLVDKENINDCSLSYRGYIYFRSMGSSTPKKCKQSFLKLMA